MADSNSLILLPPRHTAQAPQPASISQPSRSSTEDSFGQKLEKAKKQKAHAAVKKQIVETPVKVTAAKAPVTKPAAKKVPDQPAVADTTNLKQPAKATPTPAEPPTPSNEQQQPASPDPKQLPVLEDHTIAINAPVEKKPVKIAKTVVAKPDQPVVDPKLVVVEHPQQAVQKTGELAAKAQEDPTAGSNTKPAEAKAVVTAVGDQNSSNDTPANTGEFGTGKIVASGASGRKDSSPSSAQAGDQQDASTAANTAVLTDPALLAESPAAELAPAKVAAHPDLQTGGILPDISASGVGVAPGSATNIASKLADVAITPQARFIEDNHPPIVSSIQGQLMPHGGTLQLRLDPPDLGALQVTVHLRDGVMTASFETSNDEATQLLSHSLGQLKSGLEAAGVSVDKIHVEQAPKRDSQGESNSDAKQPPQEQQRQAQQDQQRREMVQRMWRKLAGGDPLDMVA